MTLEAKGHAVLRDFLEKVDMRFDNFGWRPEHHMQVRLGIGDGA